MGNLTDSEIRRMATEYVTNILAVEEGLACVSDLVESLDPDWFEDLPEDDQLLDDDLDQILEQARSDLRGITVRYVEENK